MRDRDFLDGYRDGWQSETPTPSSNRSDAYKHSFRIGYNEANDIPNPSGAVSRRAVKAIKDNDFYKDKP